ncbi:helix-turn-helix transcriptional regulator [Cohnella nanjingensis]|uniref:Helix-turn-helix transcriptional regulator n=2 Tax=Cohnella nanjingensis TaxID=1387779 RepID=A0A7X0VFG2_9BACL|nr:helix-turn-helix transcriptional regulator [Cohnella nanjingensis]
MRRKAENRTERMGLRPHLGEGTIHRLVPRVDLGMAIADFKLRRDREVHLRTETPMVELSYCLHGAREIQVSGARYQVAAGSYALQFVNPASARMHFGEDQHIRMLSIAIPVATFHRFMEATDGSREADFNRIIGSQPYRLYRETIDPTATVLLRQMTQAIDRGGIRNLEVESRMLELMSAAFSSLLQESRLSSAKLSRTDRSKIERAREIVLAKMADPPSLLELSRQIGLNDYKLKIGFKEIYGHTVFGYLRDQRLEKAYRLLQEGEGSVLEVSYAVGYSNPSYFAEAFRDKYGVNPGELLRRTSRSAR